METMLPCLTIRQPWAWAICAGRKPVENRSRPWSYRGPLLIHAALSLDALAEACADAPEPMPDDYPVPLPDGSTVPLSVCGILGHIVGMVTMVDCLPVARVRGPWALGPWCYVLTTPLLFARPIPWKGQLAVQQVPVTALAGQAG